MPYGGGFGGYQQAGGIGGFLKGLGKAAVGFVTGGPIGAVQAVVGGSKSAGSIPAPPSVPLPSSMISPVPGLTGIAQRTIPGGASGYQVAAKPSGYHYAKDGSGRLVRNRRRNFANGKALNRAIGRVAGFERMVKRNRKALRRLSRI